MLEQFTNLFERGGIYAYLIAIVSVLTYTLLIERGLALYSLGRGVERRGTQRSFTFVRALIATAPLLGLLGTVSGVVHIFESLDTTSASAGLFSEGLSEAMVTTQLGLIVAAPALLIERLLSRKAQRVATQQEPQSGTEEPLSHKEFIS